MANGDISIEQARGLLAGRPTEEQLAFIYQAIINQSHTCSLRPDECDGKYLKKEKVRLFLVGTGCFCAGSGGLSIYALLRTFGLL